MVNANELRDLIASHQEWLLIRESGIAFPLLNHEIEISGEGEFFRFGFLDDQGLHSWRLNRFETNDGEIAIDVAGAFSKNRETIRLVPRVAASELTAEIEIARLIKANEIAKLIAANFPGSKIGRVALNTDGGRVAQITFQTNEKRQMAAMADVTVTLTAESIFTAAMLWAEKLGLRKNPVNEIWLICEKRSARAAQKLHTLFTERWKSKITILEIVRRDEPPRLTALPKKRIAELWRQKPPKLAIPAKFEPSQIGQRIVKLAPLSIDAVYSKQGETLRYNGLPFARVRSVLGIEKAWFGIGRERRILNEENWDDLTDLVKVLKVNRSADSPGKRHEFYRAAPEAWLESILRRNIKLLDANLILSPIYNQFRSSNDKIDLLALRRDGRLVIIELKTQPDREMVFQAVDYWRKIELQRRRGILAAADLFEGREIRDKPALVYLAAPAWSFHRDFEFFARSVSPEIELWRFELHENWRESVKVVARHDYRDWVSGFTNR